MSLEHTRPAPCENRPTSPVNEADVAKVAYQRASVQYPLTGHVRANFRVVDDLVYLSGVKAPDQGIAPTPGGSTPAPVVGAPNAAGVVTSPTKCLLPVCAAVAAEVVE